LAPGGEVNNRKGFIASVTNQKAFFLKKTPEFNPKIAVYSDYYFKFGNE
jgi:hypothetical protein